jgi:hypothetical protein
VTVDATPPVAGTVFDGDSALDTFQSDMQTLSAHWSGFYDLESSIDV